MTVRDVIADVLLGLGIASTVVATLGVLLMPHVFDRLHYLAPATSVGGPLVALAVVVRESLSHQGIVALLVAAFLVVFGSVLTHATARAARSAHHGRWGPRPGEAVRWP
ncbi:MAG TPA: monovalent cation/H(+) antiporter subunit G [Actinomycetota bacterium]|nr:monovalent cation/H(+) antiporter subunit G [Actinomycetota bacterium]